MEVTTSLGEISASDNLRSPVTEVSQALVKELAPVSKTLQQAAASAKAGVSQVKNELRSRNKSYDDSVKLKRTEMDPFR